MIKSALESIGNGLKGLLREALKHVTLWRLMTLGSVVFAAGISGTWFNSQFETDLGTLNWGWFGATLVGTCLFAGVNTAIQGGFNRRWGFLIVGIGLIAVGIAVDTTMGAQYFAGKHDMVTGLILGFFAPLIATLCGAAEALQEWQKKQDTKAENVQKMQMDNDAHLALERMRLELQLQGELAVEKERLRQKDIAHRRELKARQAQVRELQAPPPELSMNVHGLGEQPPNVRELTTEERVFLEIVRESFGQSFTSSDAENLKKLGRTKTYEVLGIADNKGLIVREGKGKYRFP